MILPIILAIVIVLIFFWFWGKQPVVFKNLTISDLFDYLKILLFRGYDKGFLVISVQRDRKPKRFIQIAKYLGKENRTGLKLNFPHAEWSKPYFNKLKNRLTMEKIEFEIETTKSQDVPEFIVIDLFQDLNLAIRLIKLILTNVFELPETESLELYMVNISPKEEKIGLIID